MYSVSRFLDYEGLREAEIDVVIVGNGSHAMIKSYRSEFHRRTRIMCVCSGADGRGVPDIFRTPIPIYTDPTLRLYAALGMTRRTSDAGPDEAKGEYVRHGPIGGLAMVVRNALRVGMPVWEKGGDSLQLGGEFVLGPE